MVLRGTVSKRIRGEEVAIVLADTIMILGVLVSILVVDIALCIKDRLLTANTDHEPIPPNVTFDTEADHATNIGTVVPNLVVFVTGIVSPDTFFIEPVMSLSLVIDKVQAHPEEATVESDVDTNANLSMLFIQTRSIDELEVQGRHEFAVNGVQSKECTRLDQPGEVAIVKEVVVFRTVLDTGQSKREFQVEVVRELEVHTTVSLHNRGKGVLGHLVVAIFTLVTTILRCNINMQAPGIAVRERTAQEAVEVRHRFRDISNFAIVTDDLVRQILHKFSIHTAKETTDRDTRVRIVVIANSNGENATKARMLRINVSTSLQIVVGIRAEFTNQVVGVEIDVCSVIKNAHIIHDVSGVFAHRFNTGERCKGRSDTKNSKCGTDRSYGF